MMRAPRWVKAKSILGEHPCFRLMHRARVLAVVDERSEGGWWWYAIGKSSAGKTFEDPRAAMRDALAYVKEQDGHGQGGGS